ncbi:agamous-like MADS-box protein AGL62 [Hibiscus syriacus]|uniref:agamous-like MADS-box protein AGL62 n=1 Tax=Hibiscus syriacus TaxID=106335 RepID=UPI001923F207|nr:agamous-like MADS-box protein AGL62 [Hibiscus syriacus]
MEKKTLGRQRVEMKKMKNETHLLVSFSKRKAGLFKKASEIRAPFVVPSSPLLSSSRPKRRFLLATPRLTLSLIVISIATRRILRERRCSSRLTATIQLEASKERGKELKVMSSENQQQKIEDLDLSQLLELKSSMEKLQKDVEEQKLAALNASPQQFYIGNWSGQGVVPTPGYNLNPLEGYNVNLVEEYNIDPVNPTNEDNVDLVEEYIVYPFEVHNVESAQYNLTEGLYINPVNPTYEDNFDPVEEYIVDPFEVNNVGSAQEYNDNPTEGRYINPVEG